MRASDVVKKLRQELPKRTDLFSESIPASSLTASGLTATFVSSSAHGLSSGDRVVISGAKEINAISSLTFAGGVVSAETSADHKLTLPTSRMVRFGNLLDFNYADISGADQSEYNGKHLLTGVPNRRDFQYEIDGSPTSPATGSPILEQETAYNGTFTVTVVDPTTFTYPLLSSVASAALGSIVANSGFRITSAVTFPLWERGYTRQQLQNYWAVVVLGDVISSKDRNILGDATFIESKQSSFRCRLIEPFRVFVVVASKSTYSGRPIQDEMETIRGYIYHSLAGYIFPTALSEEPLAQTAPTGDRYAPEISNDSKYVHEFSFERVVDVTYPDTVGPASSAPFRDVFLESKFDFGTESLDADIDLDEEPL